MRCLQVCNYSTCTNERHSLAHIAIAIYKIQILTGVHCYYVITLAAVYVPYEWYIWQILAKFGDLGKKRTFSLVDKLIHH